ncbi:MAG: polysaccharide biosynthesis/export family protein [Gammaproteobacteria bacterium]|nr:polysaccharide biosynthesis/export family protein [Gammaproteobacteria bacterium]
MARYRFMTLWFLFVTLAISLHSVSARADENLGLDYRTQAGDVLQIGVWQEPDLNLEVIVRPDGGFSLPLIGEVTAKGRTIAELREELMDRFGKLIPDTDVFVAVRQLSGNKIYLIGKVARPGEFVINRHVDVMQALSMAGGTTVFADVNDIKILRRVGDKQQVLNFQYGEVERGMSLEQNVLLKSGDIVVVP